MLFTRLQVLITSAVFTGSSACIRFKMSATRTDAFPLALTFGMTPKEHCIYQSTYSSQIVNKISFAQPFSLCLSLSMS